MSESKDLKQQLKDNKEKSIRSWKRLLRLFGKDSKIGKIIKKHLEETERPRCEVFESCDTCDGPVAHCDMV